MFYFSIILLLIQTVISDPLSNFISSSDPYGLETVVPKDVPCYVVHPADYNTHVSDEEIAAATKLRDHLHTISNHVVEDFEPNGFLFYKVYSNDETMMESLARHHGVRHVEPQHEHVSRLAARAGPARKQRTWIAYAKKSNDKKADTATRTWLNSHVLDKKKKIIELKRKDKVKSWGHLTFDDATLREARKQKGIEGIAEDIPWSGTRAVPNSDLLRDLESIAHNIGDSDGRKARRAGLSWAKQEGVDKDLALISQSKGSQLGTNFVFEGRAGKGTFIYIIDQGVEMDIQNTDKQREFRNVVKNGKAKGEQDFQTSTSKEEGRDPNKDDDIKSPHGHGTPVASKALGSMYGVAKEATLISVKVNRDQISTEEALDLIVTDLTEDHPERAAHSVVLIARSSEDPFPDQAAAKKSLYGASLTTYFQEIISLGVPIVITSGNYGRDRTKKIDTIPALLDSNDTPLIVVGGATEQGDADYYSQGQEGAQKPTIYAPGSVRTLCKDNAGAKGSEVMGTSFAAPAVAGVIATYMNYNPWGNAKGAARVRAIKEFIQTDESSWERKKGIRMIWNGADDQAHKEAKPIMR